MKWVGSGHETVAYVTFANSVRQRISYCASMNEMASDDNYLQDVVTEGLSPQMDGATLQKDTELNHLRSEVEQQRSKIIQLKKESEEQITLKNSEIKFLKSENNQLKQQLVRA